MLFRIILGISIISVMGSCTLPGTVSESTKTSGTLLYNGSGFSMDIPNNWTTNLEKSMESTPNKDVVLSAISKEVRYGFSNNIVIMREKWITPITSKKYSELNHIQTMKNYFEHTTITHEPILFADEDISWITVFEAKYNSTTPKMKFLQTAKVCGPYIYMIHASITLDKNSDNYKSLFKTFRCQ